AASVLTSSTGSSTGNAGPSCSRCCFHGRNDPYLVGQRAGRPRRGLVPGEESPGSTELRCRVTPGGPRESGGQGQCHRKHTARLRTGKVERVRQERTAVLATGPAR